MDTKLVNEISRLTTIKDLHKQTYISNLEFLEEKLARIQNQIENTGSTLKQEILGKQREYYKHEIENIDHTIEQVVVEIDTKIQQLELKRNEMKIQAKKEAESFEFNIERIQAALVRRNTGEIFEILENMTNALVILRKEHS